MTAILVHIQFRSRRSPAFTALMGITSPLVEVARAVVGYTAPYAYGPLLGVSKSSILSLITRIKIGQLKIVDVDGQTTVCGQQKLTPSEAERTIYSIPQVELKVHKEMFWIRLALFADMVCNTRGLWIKRLIGRRVWRKATCLVKCLARILLLSSRFVKPSNCGRMLTVSSSSSSIEATSPTALRSPHPYLRTSQASCAKPIP